MYKRILISGDGSPEGLVALREGALIAQAFGAEAFLLMVEPYSVAHRIAESYYAASPRDLANADRQVAGLAHFRQPGLQCCGGATFGEPAIVTVEHAQSFGADVVVVGHRRQSIVERWWTGAWSAYLADHVGCTLMIARGAAADADLPVGPRSGRR